MKKLSDFANDRSALFRILLLAAWTFGLLLGAFCALHTPAIIHSMMHTLPVSGMSIVGSFLMFFLPLVITIILRYYPGCWFMIFFAFLKAYAFSFVSGCIILSFGEGSWLLRWLICFSSSICNGILLWVWLCLADSRLGFRTIAITSLAIGAVVAFDCFAVSPFVLMLFDH